MPAAEASSTLKENAPWNSDCRHFRLPAPRANRGFFNNNGLNGKKVRPLTPRPLTRCTAAAKHRGHQRQLRLSPRHEQHPRTMATPPCKACGSIRLHLSRSTLKKQSACFRQRQNFELGSNTSQGGYDTCSPATPPSPAVSASAHRQGVEKSRKRQSPGFPLDETATRNSNHFRKFPT